MSQTLKLAAPIITTFMETYKLEMEATPAFDTVDQVFLDRINDRMPDSFGVHLMEVADAVLGVSDVLMVSGFESFTIDGVKFISKDFIELLTHIIELKCLTLLVRKCTQSSAHLLNSYTEFTRAIRRASDIIKLATPVLDALPF